VAQATLLHRVRILHAMKRACALATGHCVAPVASIIYYARRRSKRTPIYCGLFSWHHVGFAPQSAPTSVHARELGSRYVPSPQRL